MILFITILISLALGVLTIGYYKGAEIQFAPILGFMIGSLYSYTDYDEGREHTIQICLVFLSISVIWLET